MGLLRDQDSPVARYLQKHGITRESFWQELAPGQLLPATDAPVTRSGLHELIDSLTEGVLNSAWSALVHLKAGPRPVPERTRQLEEEMRERAERGRPPGVGMISGSGGGWTTGPGGNIQNGEYTSSRFEDGAEVIETHRFHRGHEITIIQRLRLSEDGKTLSFSQEIAGPKKEWQHSLDFDVS